MTTTIATSATAAFDLSALDRSFTTLLTTFRRDGRGVGTPVHVAVEDGHAYFRTWNTTWKLKRIRHNPHVTVAPSTFRGDPTGPAFPARARVLHGADAERAARALGHRYPIIHSWLIPLFHRLHGYRTVHLELIRDR